MTLKLTGQKFGRLTAVRDNGSIHSQRLWLCRCDCGAEVTVRASSLRTGQTKSCGCLRSDGSASQKASATKHGHAKAFGTRTYSTWKAMVDRCRNENAPNYKSYGGRGISVCPQWRDFAAFLSDMGERPPRTSIDRIDSNGNYEPNNCRWATASQQNRNKRNTKLSPDDVDQIKQDTRPHARIAAQYGVSQPHITRIKSGHVWSSIDS